MNIPQVLILTPSCAHCPRELEGGLGRDSPSRLWSVGSLEILANHKDGLFCAVGCHGHATNGVYDAARELCEGSGGFVNRAWTVSKQPGDGVGILEQSV